MAVRPVVTIPPHRAKEASSELRVGSGEREDYVYDRTR
jgi:hypothetical protein